MTRSDPPADPEERSRLVLLAPRLAAVALAATTLYLVREPAAEKLLAFAAWVDSLGAWGPAAFVAGYVVATVALLPAWPLTVAAGAIFGLLEGVLWVLAGATLGATAAFLIGRHLARERVERALADRPRVRAIDAAGAGQGLKIVVLLRLSPLVPFNVQPTGR